MCPEELRVVSSSIMEAYTSRHPKIIEWINGSIIVVVEVDEDVEYPHPEAVVGKKTHTAKVARVEEIVKDDNDNKQGIFVVDIDNKFDQTLMQTTDEVLNKIDQSEKKAIQCCHWITGKNRCCRNRTRQGTLCYIHRSK